MKKLILAFIAALCCNMVFGTEKVYQDDAGVIRWTSDGLRRQDLIRFGKYVEYENARIDAINAYDSKGYFNVTDAHNRFFIPQGFIDESKSEIKQNSGY